MLQVLEVEPVGVDVDVIVAQQLLGPDEARALLLEQGHSPGTQAVETDGMHLVSCRVRWRPWCVLGPPPTPDMFSAAYR